MNETLKAVLRYEYRMVKLEEQIGALTARIDALEESAEVEPTPDVPHSRRRPTMHTDAQQTRTLHAIPAFAAWARVRGFRAGDWVEQYVDPEIYPEPCLVVMVVEDTCKMVDSATCHLNVDLADCHLMPSESDLMDFLRSRGFGTISVVASDGDEWSVELWRRGQRCDYDADTRIGALVAAAEAAERSDEG